MNLHNGMCGMDRKPCPDCGLVDDPLLRTHRCGNPGRNLGYGPGDLVAIDGIDGYRVLSARRLPLCPSKVEAEVKAGPRVVRVSGDPSRIRLTPSEVAA